MASTRCVVCRHRLGDRGHKCPRSVMALYRKAERLADLADDPEGPHPFPIAPSLIRRFRRYGLIVEFAC